MSDATPDGKVTLTKVELGGLDPEASMQLEQFARAVVNGSDVIARDLGLADDVYLSLISASDFGATVDRVRSQYGMTFTAPYQAVRTTVQAGGIMLWAVGRKPAEATVVLNAECCAGDVLSRFYLFAHEFGHVLSRAARSESVLSSAPAPSTRTNLESLADALLEEVRADRIAAWACGIALRTESGEPVALSDALGHDFIGAAGGLLEAICAFTANDVCQYRISGAGLEALISRGNALLTELLLVLTHAAAFFDAAGKIGVLGERLAVLRGFDPYLAGDWDAFTSAVLRNDSDAARAAVPEVFEHVFAKLGLRVIDLPGGSIRIDVGAPVLCE
jgi:hypothetical protein